MNELTNSSTSQGLLRAPARVPSEPLIQLDEITKYFQQGEVETRVLEGVTLGIPEGDYVALMGPSGSGKSTLLNIISGLDSPTGGRVRIGDVEITEFDETELANWRSGNIGFVFQQYNLLPVLTAFENVELPLLLTPLDRQQRRERVESALEIVGLADRMKHYPRQLSGGQEQRVSIARAIVADPSLLICDEPTGNLDQKSSREILDLFDGLNGSLKKTIVMVTHDPHAAERARTRHKLEKGRLVLGA